MAEFRIDHKDTPVAQLHIKVDGNEYGFSMEGVDPALQEWMAESLTAQMQEIHDRATVKERNNIRTGIQRLLGFHG